MNLSAEVARKLLQIKAIKLSPQKPFTWASGLRSPIYCDNRTILSFPEIRRFVINAFAKKLVDQPSFDVIAGVATAGIPHGVLLAEHLDLPFIYVRDTPKSHGRQNQIEGVLHSGARVLLIEDLISTGGSSLQAVGALRKAGAQVGLLMAIFTYGFPSSREAFARADCAFDTLTNYPTLLQIAASESYVSPEQVQLLQSWNQDPQAWSAAQTS